MSGHGSGVAETEIDVVMSVDVDHFGTVSLSYEGRECARPFGHPVHGDAAKKRFAGTVEEGFGFWTSGSEFLLFRLH
jgi:hypothetical protein